MKKNIFIIICILFSIAGAAQEQAKYLSGAVPEVDGKVVFSKTVNVNGKISDAKLFDLVNKWAEANYKNNASEPENKILLSDPKTMNIACYGEKYQTYSSSALSLDRAKMMYQLVLRVENNKCDMTVRNIKFDYQDYRKTVAAEELISNKVALNGDKLQRYYAKFRKLTVDSVANIFNSLDVYLNGIKSAGAVDGSAQTVSQPIVKEVAKADKEELPEVAKNENATSTLNGYKQIAPDKIPGNIIKLLDNWALLTSGTGAHSNMATISWGGLGILWNKPAATCYLNSNLHSVQAMGKGDIYTISFYTEAHKDALGRVDKESDKINESGLTPLQLPSGGMAFSEAWMIIECRKMVTQQFSADAISDKKLADEWGKKGYPKMYIGEIVNVWIK